MKASEAAGVILEPNLDFTIQDEYIAQWCTAVP